MTAAAFWDAARGLKLEMTGDGLTQVEVDALNSIIEAWTPKHLTNPKGLLDPAGFFASVRRGFGPLSTDQVEGFNRLLQAMGVAGWPIAWTAYGLATPWRETNKQMQPVEEGYYLGSAKAAAFQKTLRYYPWYGRGDVQLTWERNYRLADEQCGLNGALIADPTLALRPDISAAAGDRNYPWLGRLGRQFGIRRDNHGAEGCRDGCPHDGAATTGKRSSGTGRSRERTRQRGSGRAKAVRASLGFALLATICWLLAILCTAPLVKAAAQVQAPHLFAPCPVTKEVFPTSQERKA
jgi:hypothetical protein